ncbi:MAG: hypothetical protein WCL61_02385, partial [bacterium]
CYNIHSSLRAEIRRYKVVIKNCFYSNFVLFTEVSFLGALLRRPAPSVFPIVALIKSGILDQNIDR